MSGRAEHPPLIDCARAQLRVVGALVLREMHTRFGRHRLGYVALFIEPLILGAAIALIHRGRFAGDTIRNSFEFFAMGYVLFMKLRQIFTRASGTIPTNASLLYHRQIALPDLFYARHLIESAACTGVLAVFAFAAIAMGGQPPDSPVKMLAAAALMLLLAQGLAMMIAAFSSEWHGLERVFHIMTYLLMPISGVFFMLEWLPEWLQEILYWVPTVHIFELMRDGQFGDRVRAMYDLQYVTMWILVAHLLGLAGLRIARARLGLE